MGKKSRDKGINGELEAAKVLEVRLGLKQRPERILDQTRGQDNGLDLVVGPFGIQVKRHKTIGPAAIDNALREATVQTTEDPEFSGLFPVAMTRADRQGWMITMWLTDVITLIGGGQSWPPSDDVVQLTVTMTVVQWAPLAAKSLWRRI